MVPGRRSPPVCEVLHGLHSSVRYRWDRWLVHRRLHHPSRLLVGTGGGNCLRPFCPPCTCPVEEEVPDTRTEGCRRSSPPTGACCLCRGQAGQKGKEKSLLYVLGISYKPVKSGILFAPTLVQQACRDSPPARLSEKAPPLGMVVAWWLDACNLDTLSLECPDDAGKGASG